MILSTIFSSFFHLIFYNSFNKLYFGVSMSSDNIDLYNPNRFGDLLFIFHTNHKKYLNDLFSQYDLNLVQVLCLLRLNEENNLNQKDLSDGFYLTKGAITKAVKKLEKNNFIIREKSTSDKRQYTLTLTSKGKNMIPIIEEINAQWENEIGLNEVSQVFNKTFTRLTFKSVELNKNKK